MTIENKRTITEHKAIKHVLYFKTRKAKFFVQLYN